MLKNEVNICFLNVPSIPFSAELEGVFYVISEHFPFFEVNLKKENNK